MKNKPWNPFHSKWKAALEKGLDVKISGHENILYLGASSGTIVEKISNQTKGIIFAVEKSLKMAIPLVNLAIKKQNIAPLFCDAQNTDYIGKKIKDIKIDILFQDIPSINQIDILNKNSKFIKEDTKIFLSLKTQSISQEDPHDTFKKTSFEIRKNYEIIEAKSLDPFQKKHYFFILKKKLLAR